MSLALGELLNPNCVEGVPKYIRMAHLACIGLWTLISMRFQDFMTQQEVGE